MPAVVAGQTRENAWNSALVFFFQSNGMADEDLAVGRYVLEQVQRKKVRVRKVSEV